ncbi:Ankyrin-2 [Colletotrichum siamense]|nr:Ankyrin-2 [Colletotrichum siamense]
MRSHLHQEEDLKILDWLTSTDYGKQHSDFFSRHQPGTGQWFLDSDPFETWSKFQGKTLFCPGIPGSGKTIITSIVVNFLRRTYQSQSFGLAYIYCNYQSHKEQRLPSLLASILKQLSQTGSCLPKAVRDLHEMCTKLGEELGDEDLIEAIVQVSGLLSKVFFVVDALDECQTTEDCRSKLISHLTRIQEASKVNIMYTSRHVLEIEGLFVSCLKQPIRAEGYDVGIVVDSQLPWILERVQGGIELGSTIKSAITNLVDGMFLLAQLYLDVIKDATSIAEVRKTLKQLEVQNSTSSGDDEKRHILEQAYDQAMARIQNQPPNVRRLGMRTLTWIVFAERPLGIVELQHALAIEETDTKFDPEKVRTIELILTTCAGLVTIDEKSDTVRLAHFTTQEYFVSKQNEYFASAQSDIVSACATYLCFQGLRKHVIRHTPRKKCPDHICQLAAYATSNWSQHARKHEASSLHASPKVVGLLRDEELVSYAWAYARGVQLHQDTGRKCVYPRRYRIGAYGLHVAIHYDLIHAAEDLIEGGADLDYNPDKAQTPLMAAASGGKERFIKLLLEKGASIDMAGSIGSNALVVAWKARRENVVTMLLNEGTSFRRAKEMSEKTSKKSELRWFNKVNERRFEPPKELRCS